MHKFAVIHKPSSIVCYSSDKLAACVAPSFNYDVVLNSIEYKTVSPDLAFDSYAEIADAINLSDVLVFTKDSDDNLTIADNTRSVSVPALLFQELLLQVEEVAFGDVCEIVEAYAFNRECTELLAGNAIKFWVAARFLELSPVDTTETSEIKIKTLATGLEIHDSNEFEGESAFTYKGDEFLLCDFVYTDVSGWHGVMGLSYFSAYYARYENDGTVTLGYAHW